MRLTAIVTALVLGGASATAAPPQFGGEKTTWHGFDRYDFLMDETDLSIKPHLAAADEGEFSAVRDTVEVSDSVLSRQVSTLEAAGYVKVRKGYVGKRPRTWRSLTAAGRTAFDRHLAALRAIAEGSA